MQEQTAAPSAGGSPAMARGERAAARGLFVGAALSLSLGALAWSGPPGRASEACPGERGFFCRRAVIPAPDVDFVRAADLDAGGGDGDLDFIGVASGLDDLYWFENDGQAFAGYEKRLHQHLISQSSNGVSAADAGDADGDGDLDIYTLSSSEQQLSLWANQLSEGRGFTRAGSRGLAGAYSHLEAADLDGDGRTDLVLTEGAGGPGAIDVWRNPGGDASGSLLAYKRFPVAGQSRVSRVSVGDLDGDGLPDLLATVGQGTGDELRWWRQEAGQPGAGPAFSAKGSLGRLEDLMDAGLADLDGDGHQDIVALTMRALGGGAARSQVLVLGGDGHGGFAAPRLLQDSTVARSNDGMWTSLDVGDVNRDGAWDFLASEPVERGVLCWYENPAGGAATATPSASASPAGTGRPSPPAGSPTVPTVTASAAPSTASPPPVSTSPVATASPPPPGPSRTAPPAPPPTEPGPRPFVYLPRLGGR